MQIVINKSYFDNIKVAIDAMNNFFASGFKTKAFPVVNNDFQLDRILSRTLSWLNNIEPSWVDDPNKAIETLNTLKEIVSKETPSAPVTESAEFIQEFTLLELIAACGAIAVGVGVGKGIARGVKRHKENKAIRENKYEKLLFEQLKKVTKLIENTYHYNIMRSSWSYTEPKDDDKSHDWFHDQLDFKYHCDEIVKQLNELKDSINDCIEKKTPIYEALQEDTEYFKAFISKLIHRFEIDEIDYDKNKYYTKEDINNIKDACASYEKETTNFLKLMKEKFADVIKEAVEEAPADPTNPWVKIISGEDKTASDMFHAFIGFKVLQYITNNFDKYEQLLNGVYSFELFTKPSMYRDAITVFTAPIPMPELDAIAKLPGEYKLFDASDYVNSIFENDQIKLPEEMNSDTEIQRFQSFGDLQDCEVVINDSVQEAAAIDYFTNPVENIKYSKGKWKISRGFESQVNALLDKLRKCETTEDLIMAFQTIKLKPELFASTVAPAILVRTLSNPQKYPKANKTTFSDYQKSYISIVKKNAGAVRFERIDLFSTFKTDKEGTIQFLEDFLKLNLVNDEKSVISNNTVLTVFNIFDSHIYFSILYNAMDAKQKEAESLDGFIKRIRSRINQNSRSANPYQKKKEVKKSIEGSDQVVEFALETMKELGDLSVADMRYCESFHDAVDADIETIGDALYNRGVSQVMIDHYIGESYSLFMNESDFYQEGFFKKMKEKKKQKQIESLERIYGRKIPAQLVEFVEHRPKRSALIKYLKGPGYLGIVFNLGDMEAAATSFDFSTSILVKHDLVMFAEWYAVSDVNVDIDDVDPDDVGCLYLNLENGSIMYSPNPFNDRKITYDDFKKLETSLQSLCDHLDDWPGKPTLFKPGAFQEAAETGEIPNYLKERVGISDDVPKKPQQQKKSRFSNVEDDDDDDIEVPEYMKNRMDAAGDIDLSVTEINLPPDVPSNNVEDLADSIDARLNTKADSLGDMLGADYKGNIKPASQGGPGTVIYNITNNYNNSHNTTTTNDLSTNKKTNTSTITTTSNDLSSNKRTNSAAKNKPSNNYDNTRPSSNSKESDTFSTGKSIQEVFALLNSEEPLFVESDAGKPPKGDMLTSVMNSAMDADKATLSLQQKAKRGVQKVMNTGRAIKKPITRTKQWLKGMVDSLIKRDEDRVKADLVQNPSYRSALYKTARIALKTGKFALFYAVSPFLGVGYLGMQGLKLADRDRLRKEANQEILTEIQIIDQKIEDLKSGSRWGEKQSPEERQELYKLMRMRQKLLDMSTASHKQRLANPKSVY